MGKYLGPPAFSGIVVLFGIMSLLPALASGVEIAPHRHAVGAKAPNAFVPYTASHSLSKPNRQITRILFSIHSSGFDAFQYYNNARAAAAKVRGVLLHTHSIVSRGTRQSNPSGGSVRSRSAS